MQDRWTKDHLGLSSHVTREHLHGILQSVSGDPVKTFCCMSAPNYLLHIRKWSELQWPKSYLDTTTVRGHTVDINHNQFHRWHSLLRRLHTASNCWQLLWDWRQLPNVRCCNSQCKYYILHT